jgi:hypothetical protein
MNVSDVLRANDVGEPSKSDVMELSDLLGCSESDAAKLIRSAELLRTFYERETSVRNAEQEHKVAKKTLKEYIKTRLDVADDLVPYFNADPCGPAVKVMVRDNNGDLNPHKPWKHAPDYWTFLVSLSNEAFIPDLR